MKALTFSFSYPRLAAAKVLSALSPRGALTSLGPLGYGEVPDPGLLGDDWVIVQTNLCGICGSDVKQVYLEGSFDNPMSAVISFPHVLGHEVVGTVAETGKAVSRVRRGDRVACYPWITCRVRGLPECAACAAGDLSLCRNFTAGRFAPGIHHGNCRDLSGGFATYMPAHESACFRVPDTVSQEQAALADPFSVCLHGIAKSPPLPGEKVLVFGCGALGMLAIHILSRLYPGVEVLCVDLHQGFAPLAQRLGASEFFALPPRALIEAIAERTGTRLLKPLGGLPWLHGGVDHVYDTVATAGTLEIGVRVLRPRGKLVMLGVAPPERFEWTPIYFKELSVIGTSGFGIEGPITAGGPRDHAFALYLDLVASGRVDPAGVVTHTLPMSDYRAGFLAARRKQRSGAVKVLLDPAR